MNAFCEIALDINSCKLLGLNGATKWAGKESEDLAASAGLAPQDDLETRI